ncbi:predicted protein [Phaeodactylum tricornutum CCAP 1055/1]|jgi:hypothetical protein|uniref:Uncharacterized protein n=2 Tax=Phaeodactylum tricornutum TaxID=2850 RepID=B7GDV5_PHATC|nr:predicted protein [Phaeodactylum tricornutum CCAP 1055/1]EEC43190.1 predicted protein [Phaeodactylum tricornutum CCAP 1055/1]|eukprot:XP_002185321.1 predicted protein [Phaeodactylum tricornutum CCAP 1055/1]
MPRFSDEWVIDRVLFDYVSGGSCACCGFAHFLPNGTVDLINAMSDLDTDQANAEKAALVHHPWPTDLRDQVWADRVRLRQKLKREMKAYREFWDEHADAFRSWCRTQKLKRMLQLPRSEIMETLRQKYNIHSAYGVVLCATLEQVAHFSLTGYPTDGRGDAESTFEDSLIFNRRGGLTLKDFSSHDEHLCPDVIRVLCDRIGSLGGPKLLERAPASTEKRDGDDEDDADAISNVGSKISFQSDRRIVRLIVARYWADLLQARFLTVNKSEPQSY